MDREWPWFVADIILSVALSLAVAEWVVLPLLERVGF